MIKKIVEMLLGFFAGKPAVVEETAEEKARREKAKKEASFRENYAKAMERVEDFASKRFVKRYGYDKRPTTMTDEEIAVGLSGLRKIAANNLAFSVMSKYVYDPEVTSCEYVPWVPTEWLDENGNKVFLQYYRKKKVSKEEIIPFDRTEMTLIACPGIDEKFVGHMERPTELKGEWMSDETPTFYKNFELLYPGGNRHKLVDAFLNRNTGTIRTYVVDDIELFENLTTDGAFWYMKDGRKVDSVSDWRIAVIFSIRQKELELEGKI